jgi:hypothetical protein
MEYLPKDVLVLLAMEMSYPEILKFCQTNKNINRAVCKNNYFWRNKLYKDYPSLEEKDYLKVYSYIALGKKILDKTFDPHMQNVGFQKLIYIKQELLNFLLNADLGTYKTDNLEVPINYILLPVLDKNIFNIATTSTLFRKYLNKYKFMEGEKIYYRVGPEMDKYLNKQLTELENNTNKPFNRNKFTFNRINEIVHKLFESQIPAKVNSDILSNLGKIHYIIKKE